MRRFLTPKSIQLGTLLLAGAGGFGILAVCEQRIEAAGMRSEVAFSRALVDEHVLRNQGSIEATGRQVERRIEELSLSADSSAQEALLLGQLERVASGRGIRVMAIRKRALKNEAAGVRPARSLVEHTYEVVLKGRYRGTLRMLADLARIPLVLRTDSVSFERLRRDGRSTRDIVATFGLSIVQLAQRQGEGRVASITP